MSALTSEFYKAPDSQPYQPTVAELQEILIDFPNAEREARQMSAIENIILEHEGKPFHLTSFRPTDGLRTWTNEFGDEVQYPELLMVHGVASDERYFWSLFQKMNKLGIACSAIELPREHGVIHDAQGLLDWQVGATVATQKFLQEQHSNQHVVLGGHSRGSIVTVKAAERIVAENGSGAIDGILLLAPSVEPKSLGRVGLNLFTLAYNSFKHSRDIRLVSRYVLMIAEVVAENVQQSIIETKQALTINVKEEMYHSLKDVSFFIPAGENDEFVDHKALAQLALFAPEGNISITTLNTNHMLGEREQQGVRSQADPRLLSGQVLSWLQSLTKTYRPLSLTHGYTKTKRL